MECHQMLTDIGCDVCYPQEEDGQQLWKVISCHISRGELLVMHSVARSVCSNYSCIDLPHESFDPIDVTGLQ